MEQLPNGLRLIHIHSQSVTSQIRTELVHTNLLSSNCTRQPVSIVSTDITTNHNEDGDLGF